ncbi:MAG TPA: hypothetical protein ENI17_01830 [Pseudomonas xinjiangensis]|uniref:Uncharacterized protein n=1 Tax=marine sediment metagenome TaxID=412755 RepID=A0A0F9U7P4_9ZZZZ|nr:hypothetical protein [Halopseudomonas xinjiangensis]
MPCKSVPFSSLHVILGAGRGSRFSVSASAAGGFSACAENDGEGWGSGSLTPSGTEQLKQITELNYGSVLELSVDGIYAVKATIFSTIDSGVVRVNHPSPELLDKLKRY